MTTELAMLGGEKAITADSGELWQRPVEAEKAAVCALIDEGYLSGSGSGVPKEFEERFAEYLGCKYVLTTSHGHTALASGFFAAGLGAGDEFITPAIGYIGSYAGALHMGATPVFCELDPETLLMDPADAARRITDKTRVISPIHSCGRVCDMDRLLDLADAHDLVVVEDAAHAHGSEWDGVKIGNMGHIACFSMQGSTPGGKPVAGGEAGIVATNDRELYERALIYCHLHRPGAVDELTNPVYRELEPQLLGWKWRPHPLAMAIGLVSLGHLPDRLDRFEANRETLFRKIEGLPGIRPVCNYRKARGVELYGGIKFIYDPEALGGLPAGQFVAAMRAEGAPLNGPGMGHMEHLRSIYTKDLPGLWGEGHVGPANVPLPRYRKGDFPVSEAMNARVLSYPGHIQAADGFIDQFAAAFRKVVLQHHRLLRRGVR